MIDLSEYEGPWPLILQKLRRGERIERQEVVDALTSHPVPDAARPFLLAVVSGEYKFTRGIKPIPLFDSFIKRDIVYGVVARIEHVIKDKNADLIGIDLELAVAIKDARYEVHGDLFRKRTAR